MLSVSVTVMLIKRNALSICPLLASVRTKLCIATARLECVIAIVAIPRAARIRTLGPCGRISHLLPAHIGAINHATAAQAGGEMHATTAVGTQASWIISARPLAIQAGAGFTTGTVAATEISSPHRLIRRDRLATIATMHTSAHRPAIRIATHRSMRFKAIRKAHQSHTVAGASSSITIRSFMARNGYARPSAGAAKQLPFFVGTGEGALGRFVDLSLQALQGGRDRADVRFRNVQAVARGAVQDSADFVSGHWPSGAVGSPRNRRGELVAGNTGMGAHSLDIGRGDTGFHVAASRPSAASSLANVGRPAAGPPDSVSLPNSAIET
jgi:hypothetical protein